MTEPAIEHRQAIPPWTLGWRLQRALAWANLTTEQMADELGVARSTVSRWCNDKGRPTRGYLKLWALRCGVPFEWLMNGEQLPQSTLREWAARDSNPEPMDPGIEPAAASAPTVTGDHELPAQNEVVATFLQLNGMTGESRTRPKSASLPSQSAR